jgi:hypothetical protein
MRKPQILDTIVLPKYIELSVYLVGKKLIGFGLPPGNFLRLGGTDSSIARFRMGMLCQPLAADKYGETME